MRMIDNPSPVKPQRVAVLIDVANAEDVDFRGLLARAAELGRLEEVRAYGDFRQRHLDPIAIELYVLGVEMIHCPSWISGAGKDNGTGRRKRTDDCLLAKGVRDLLCTRPGVFTYLLVTSDADIIPTCHAIRERGHDVVLMCPDIERTLGHVLRQCGFQMEPAPMLPEPRNVAFSTPDSASLSFSEAPEVGVTCQG